MTRRVGPRVGLVASSLAAILGFGVPSSAQEVSNDGIDKVVQVSVDIEQARQYDWEHWYEQGIEKSEKGDHQAALTLYVMSNLQNSGRYSTVPYMVGVSHMLIAEELIGKGNEAEAKRHLLTAISYMRDTVEMARANMDEARRGKPRKENGKDMLFSAYSVEAASWSLLGNDEAAARAAEQAAPYDPAKVSSSR